MEDSVFTGEAFGRIGANLLFVDFLGVDGGVRSGMELSSGTTEHNVVGVEFTTVNDDDKFDPFGVFTKNTILHIKRYENNTTRGVCVRQI
jgi:hypothetical protein